MSHQLILLRHGQSVWNLENRFTGWQDVDLSEQGLAEARRAGQTLKQEGVHFDQAFTSVLKRAIRTLWIALDELDLMWIPVVRTWTLNERHYGALTGLDKRASVEQHGADQVQVWRRSFETPPPPMDRNDPRHPRFDPRYQGLDPACLPDTECLGDCLDRVRPFFEQRVLPRILEGQKLLLVAHGNSLRALVMYLDKLSPEVISKLNIPTGFPLLYELDERGTALGHRYLGDPAQVQAAISGVANQTRTV